MLSRIVLLVVPLFADFEHTSSFTLRAQTSRNVRNKNQELTSASSLFVSSQFHEPEIPFFISSEPAVKTDDDTTGQQMEEWIFQANKLLIDTVYTVISALYPVTGTERDFVRFYVLETVARVPYFAYLSVLHFQETLGVRYDSMSDRMWMHYAEADNELHHLLIMESLLEPKENEDGIVQKSALYWWDRALAQVMALTYFWYVVVIFILNQAAAYHLSELIEDHAYNTYDTFLAEQKEKLVQLPVPEIARQYYERDVPLMHGHDQPCVIAEDSEGGIAAPLQSSGVKLENLYDVFVHIRNDEKEHWATLCNLVQYDQMSVFSTDEVTSTQPKKA